MAKESKPKVYKKQDLIDQLEKKYKGHKLELADGRVLSFRKMDTLHKNKLEDSGQCMWSMKDGKRVNPVRFAHDKIEFVLKRFETKAKEVVKKREEKTAQLKAEKEKKEADEAARSKLAEEKRLADIEAAKKRADVGSIEA